MSGQFCITLTTSNSDSITQQIIESALKKGLAACIQTMPIRSHYIWEGKICNDKETLLIMKTKKACYAELEQVIVSNHNYEVPQVVQVPFTEGFNPYLTWIEESTRC
ncbi:MULTISPECIES: divalent-cation tolerance protein CutA [Vibrio]|uniref:divalent-cation tolerance protein CutA n=1 Tax=Vibrio TaxID=662 RepID=UPI001EFC2F6B|nr:MULTISPECIES: divalent-cation tolerance protein CutA [Vibrio]MCG9677130.1 divalent-cation tolerance protein CutA [Vibrio sp. Isolate24]USD34222.1 divalent-cation tolerance protein CutA [Vibrio sp. SCSIO 43186]USD47294.1 divalent-cation tolerance protein CutA [Vibrio sp. SCSIO 43145]USD71346.1 divalent-cation tolerance protein CutA [Vibrio sp. SCSIO 43139]USD98257.1 cytochrome C biogenesis protein [Vibrio coralliilyticus]